MISNTDPVAELVAECYDRCRRGAPLWSLAKFLDEKEAGGHSDEDVWVVHRCRDVLVAALMPALVD